MLAQIEDCQRATGRDTARLEDCLPEPPPDVTPLVLGLMEVHRFFLPDGRSNAPGIDAFFEKMASEAEDPALRAAARYYVAAGLMRSANGIEMQPDEQRVDRTIPHRDAHAAALQRAAAARRAATRQRPLDAATRAATRFNPELSETVTAWQAALYVATGLSAGVEEEEFRGYSRSGTTVRTFAEAEADLIHSIRHGTVSGTLPELTGTRLDGVEDSLSAYRGRVVLLDFWATWCGPCVGALPKLRELVADLPADRFVLLAINVDEKRRTVTRFIENEPMPWTNWHAGLGSDIERMLDVRGYPTYVLINEHGEILARANGLFDQFTSVIKATVEG